MRRTKGFLKVLTTTTITTAVSAVAQTATEQLDGVSGINLEAIFTYGAGGTKTTAWVQTSLDGGATYFDIACFTFTTASAKKAFNLSATTPVTTEYTPTDGTLADDTCKDGFLGQLFRVKLTTTGTYTTSTTLQIVGNVR